jgi:hypothetical protein
MGKTDLDTDASASAAVDRCEEHRGGRSTRMRSARRGSGSGSSEAIAAGVGDRRRESRGGAAVPACRCRLEEEEECPVRKA